MPFHATNKQDNGSCKVVAFFGLLKPAAGDYR